MLLPNSPTTSQPQGSMALGKDISKSDFAVTPLNMLGTKTAGVTIGNSTYGKSFDFPNIQSNTADGIVLPARYGDDLLFGGPSWLMFQIYTGDIAFWDPTQNSIAWKGNSGANAGWYLIHYHNNQIEFGTLSSTRRQYITGNAYPVGSWINLIVANIGTVGTTVLPDEGIYVNGVYQTTVTNAGGGTYTSDATYPFNVGTAIAGFAPSATGRVVLAASGRGHLTRAEITAMSQNPWLVFGNQKRKMILPLVAILYTQTMAGLSHATGVISRLTKKNVKGASAGVGRIVRRVNHSLHALVASIGHLTEGVKSKFVTMHPTSASVGKIIKRINKIMKAQR